MKMKDDVKTTLMVAGVSVGIGFAVYMIFKCRKKNKNNISGCGCCA